MVIIFNRCQTNCYALTEYSNCLCWTGNVKSAISTKGYSSPALYRYFYLNPPIALFLCLRLLDSTFG